MMRKINIILICILVILLTGCGENLTQVEEQNIIVSEENNSSNETIDRFQKEELNWTTIMLDQSPIESNIISEEESMSEEEWLAFQGYTDEKLFYKYSDDENGYEIILYCTENMDSGGGILKSYLPKGITEKLAFTFDGSKKYIAQEVYPLTIFSEFYTTSVETTILNDKTIIEYFNQIEKTYGETFTQFVYQDEQLMYMTEWRNHGSVLRFYIYRQNWEGTINAEPRYMLEIDPGWGVMFYSFE